jgi:hypothetical protein
LAVENERQKQFFLDIYALNYRAEPQFQEMYPKFEFAGENGSGGTQN